MTEQELQDIGAGLKRWHSISIDIGEKLLNEIYRLRHHIGMESMHIDILYRERDEAIQELERFKNA